MSKRTKGEWEQSGSIIWSMGHGVICELSEPQTGDHMIRHERIGIGSPNFDEAMANGAFIIAAFDLLAALEGIMADYERIGTWSFSSESLDATRAAIAAAKGEEE